MTEYVFRFDDVYPYMKWDSFKKAAAIFLKHGVPAVLCVTPEWKLKEYVYRGKKYKYIFGNLPHKKFYDEVRKYAAAGWEIALHGHTHEFLGKGGYLKKDFGEFAGLPYQQQYLKIKKAAAMLKKEKLTAFVFAPPAHAYDWNTIKAVKNNQFTAMNDGFGLYPECKQGMLFIPQLLSHPKAWLMGTVTVALHTNKINDETLQQIDCFIKKHRPQITTLAHLMEMYSSASGIKKGWWKVSNSIFRVFWQLRYLLLKKMQQRYDASPYDEETAR